MRTLILLFTLVISTLAALPSGTRVVRTITINHSQVSETSDHFFYERKIPMDDTLKSEIDSASNVCVIDSGGTTLRPKWVNIYAARDTLVLYLDAAVSHTIDKKYQLCVGKKVNVLNSASTFTNCGVTNAWLTDDSIGSTIVVDPAGGTNGVLGTNTELAKGYFGNSIFSRQGAGGVHTTLNGNIYPITFSALIKPMSLGSSDAGCIISCRTSEKPGWGLSMFPNNRLSFLSNNTRSASSAVNSVPLGQWTHITFTVSSDNKINFYINGVLSDIPNQPITRPPTWANLSFAWLGGASAAFDGNIDQPLIYNSVQSSGAISDQYKMLFTPSTFSTLGPTVSVGAVKNKSKMHNGLGLF